ncbi:MAG TPA: subclass B1 metallo-beta-lactamase, partial [Anaeromyxobacteraceae bacterium]|nr:subclass B1 metallo-beta-lactamase [Anaeromyxobacteraceae bacterium]
MRTSSAPFLALAVVLVAPALAFPAAPERETETDLGQRVWVRPVAENVWVIRSVSPLEGFGDVESNAVLVAGATESVLVDTPATDGQTVPVLAWAEQTLGRPVRHLVVT